MSQGCIYNNYYVSLFLSYTEQFNRKFENEHKITFTTGGKPPSTAVRNLT